MSDETNKQTLPPSTHVEGLDNATMQKLREALRFSASRSVMSAEDERCILSAIDALAPAQHLRASILEEAAQVAERYDETSTLTAPKAIAANIRALRAITTTKEAPCSEGEEDDNLKDCFRHHITTTIGWLAFGARPGPEMQMYEEGFKAGYRRCQSDNEPELGEEDDDVAVMRKTLEWIEDYALAFADLEEVAKRAGMALRADLPPQPRELWP